MKLLKKLYEISSPSRKEYMMSQFIKSLLTAMKVDFSEDKHGNIYATKGESETYPCVVCHIDEVHDIHEDGYRVVESNGLMFGVNDKTKSFEGIGADDKNGIWVCIKALNKFDVLKCAFFVSEEVGCIGSMSADMAFFDDCRFVLQCDRKGNKDFIIEASCTELCGSDFIQAIGIHRFGYEVAHGMMTDVMTLKERGLAVCACNISCGYYNPHTDNEMTCIADLMNCFDLVCHIIENLTQVFPHEAFCEYEIEDSYNPNGFKSVYGMDSWWSSEDKDSYDEQYDQMITDMYDYATQNDNFSLDTFIQMYGSLYPDLKEPDFAFACEEIMGCVTD